LRMLESATSTASGSSAPSGWRLSYSGVQARQHADVRFGHIAPLVLEGHLDGAPHLHDVYTKDSAEQGVEPAQAPGVWRSLSHLVEQPASDQFEVKIVEFTAAHHPRHFISLESPVGEHFVR
jgi:hypothetical protein